MAASPGLVTVIATTAPAPRSAPINPAGGQPKVKLTTGGGSASKAATLPSKLSSSQVASPRSAAGPTEPR